MGRGRASVSVTMKSRVRRTVENVLLGLAIGVAVTAIAATGVVAMAIYAEWLDTAATPEHECECCA